LEKNILKIKVIVPTVAEKNISEIIENNANKISHVDAQLSFEYLEKGVALTAPRHEVIASLPSLLHRMQAAEKAGFDAIVMPHYLDYGLEAARELVNIPVYSGGQATYRLAGALSRRIAIITTEASHVGAIEDIITDESLRGKVVAIKQLKGDVPQNGAFPESLLALATEVVEQAGARLVILALPHCQDWSARVKAHLTELTGVNFPVLDPLKVAIKHAENTVEMGITHSKLSFPTPEIREIDGGLCFK